MVNRNTVGLTISHYFSERKKYAETYSFSAALLPLSVATTIQPVSILQDQTDDAVCSKKQLNQISAEGLEVPMSEMSLKFHTRWHFISCSSFLSTIYLCQLFLFAPVIYITFSLHTVVYMSPMEIKCQLRSYSKPFSVVSSEKQILQLNELF